MRSRGFSLLEVLLAIALLGTSIMFLLVTRANCIDSAGDAIRLRSIRLLVGQHAGHHLAYHCDPGRTPPVEGWQEQFPDYAVEPRVEEVTLDELLPEDVKLVAQPKEHDGAPGSGTPPPAGTEAKAAPLQIRRFTLNVAPPEAETNVDLVVKLVTYVLVPPAKDPAAGPASPGAAKWPEYPKPLIGPDAEAAPPAADPNSPPAGDAPPPPPGGDPPPGGG